MAIFRIKQKKNKHFFFWDRAIPSPSKPFQAVSGAHHGVQHFDLREGLGQDEERRVGGHPRGGEAGEGLALRDDAWESETTGKGRFC